MSFGEDAAAGVAALGNFPPLCLCSLKPGLLVTPRAYRIAFNKGVQTVDFYSAVGGVTALLVGFSTRRCF